MLRLSLFEKTVLSLFLCLFAREALAQSNPVDPRLTQQPAAVRSIKAIVVDDRLSVLRRDADIKSQILQRLRLGRPVMIVGAKNRRAGQPKFYRVAVTRRTRGWIHEAALAVPARAGQDTHLLRLIESSADSLDRITLCRILIERFSRSPLVPRALLALGQEADRAAISLGQRARRRLADIHEKSMSADVRDYYLNDPGLDRYSRLRVNFDFIGSTAELVYDGQAFRELLLRFPKSDEASQARKRLAMSERKQAP